MLRPLFVCGAAIRWQHLANIDTEGLLAAAGTKWDCLPLNPGLVSASDERACDAIIVAVAHYEIKVLGSEGVHAFGREPHVTYGIENVLSKDEVDGRL